MTSSTTSFITSSTAKLYYQPAKIQLYDQLMPTASENATSMTSEPYLYDQLVL